MYVNAEGIFYVASRIEEVDDVLDPVDGIHTVVFPKVTGLGMAIKGGINDPETPYVVVDHVLDGMDTAKVSCIFT